MKQSVRLVLTLALCLVLSLSGVLVGVPGARAADTGAWTAVNTGFTNQWVASLAVNPVSPTTLYAGTLGGVFRSTDSGATWTGVNTWLTEQWVSSLAINPLTPATVYAGTDGGGVFRSMDGGTTWTAGNTGLTYQYVEALSINPLTPATLYAGTYSGGVFRSMDSGTIWTAVNTGLSDQYVWALAINPLAPTTMYAGTNGGGVSRYDAVSSYALTTTASPSAGGSIGRSPDASSYAPGTIVTLTATPAYGYTFTGWSGDLMGTTNPGAITMNGHNTVTANFAASTASMNLSLLPSWNVISVPFPTPVGLLPTCDLVLSWDGSFWQSASPTNLPPGLGFLLQASSPGIITLTRLP